MTSKSLFLVLLGLVCLSCAGRITGPITFSAYNPIFPQYSINLELPNTVDGLANATWVIPTNNMTVPTWTNLSACIPKLGRVSWATNLFAAMNDTEGNEYPDFKTFAALYNSNGKLSGYFHATLSNMSYDYADPVAFWIHMPPSSGHPIFDLPSHQWIHVIHLENVTNLCNGQGMAKNFVGAGDIVLLNQDTALGDGATPRSFPYNKTDARSIGFGHAPTGDACIPMMGCHWFDLKAGAPIYPQWVAGFDVYGELQFTEVMTTAPQPIYGTQWELVPAGAIPEFGNQDWYFRHVHVKNPMSGCNDVCLDNRDDCHPTANCSSVLGQAPYFKCTCPNDPTIVTTNGGRGPNGCSTCPIGKVPSADRRLCIDACSVGYVADATGACVDVDDCPTSACAADETCLNLKGNPYACVYSQVASVAQLWASFVSDKNASEIAMIISPNDGVVVLSFTVGKRAELIVTLADTAGVSDADAASKFAAASGVDVIALFDAKQRLVVKVSSTDNVNVVDSDKDSASTLFVASAALVFAALALLL